MSIAAVLSLLKALFTAIPAVVSLIERMEVAWAAYQSRQRVQTAEADMGAAVKNAQATDDTSSIEDAFKGKTP